MQRPVAVAVARARARQQQGPPASTTEQTKQAQPQPLSPVDVSPHDLSGAEVGAGASTTTTASSSSSSSSSCSSASSCSCSCSSSSSSLLFAYVLWATLGMFGAHHLYLGRDKHAILWCSSFGGFGCGWFRDFFRLPAYVRLANRDWATQQMLRVSQRVSARPPWSCVHVVGQFLFAWWFGVLLCGCLDTWAGVIGLAVPTVQPVPDLTAQALAVALSSPQAADSWYVWFRLIKMGARCVGVVAGVWLVGTVNSEQTANARLIALAAVVGQAYTLYEWQTRDLNAPKGPDDTPDHEVPLQTIDTSWYAILAAAAVYHATRRWVTLPNDSDFDPEPNPNPDHPDHPALQPNANAHQPSPRFRSRSRSRRVGSCGRVLVMVFVMVLLLVSLGTFTLTCVTVESSSGESVTLLQAWSNFVHSPAYRDLMAALGQLYREWQQHGTRNIFEQLKQQFDVDGTEHAYQVLQLPHDADFQAVRAAHKRLILVWHPDKYPDKELATAKFQEIQHAYETLEKLHKHKQTATATATATATPGTGKGTGKGKQGQGAGQGPPHAQHHQHHQHASGPPSNTHTRNTHTHTNTHTITNRNKKSNSNKGG